LPAADAEFLAKWVEMGAPWPKETPPSATKSASLDWTALRRQHWAWQPVVAVPPPAVRNAAWAKTPLDCFVLHRLVAAGLAPAPPADRATLIRRASLDLTGLPPTPEEVTAFVQDPSPQAFGIVVDRLLASPHYGERWARYWLDIAHYSDGFGNGFDGP